MSTWQIKRSALCVAVALALTALGAATAQARQPDVVERAVMAKYAGPMPDVVDRAVATAKAATAATPAHQGPDVIERAASAGPQLYEAVPPSSFDWADAGIGAGVSLLLALLLFGAAVATRRHRRITFLRKA